MSLNEVLQLIARLLLSVFFIMSGTRHLTGTKAMAQYAAAAGKIPAPAAAVVVSGLMLLAGGLALLLGVHPRIGAGLIFIFVVIAAFTMHAYWRETDPMQKAGQQAHFWKNIALAGAMLFIIANTGWPWPLALG